MSVSRNDLATRSIRSGRVVVNLIIPLLLAASLLSGCACRRDGGCSNPSPETTTIVNLADDEYDVYIGRRSDPRTHMLTEGVLPGEEGWLGNPHPIGQCDLCDREHTRDECIAEFSKDFHRKLAANDEFRKAVLALHGKRLGCYCKPRNCHGDVIRSYIDSGRQ
jgi:Domain of unknown function (DUF4326)